MTHSKHLTAVLVSYAGSLRDKLLADDDTRGAGILSDLIKTIDDLEVEIEDTERALGTWRDGCLVEMRRTEQLAEYVSELTDAALAGDCREIWGISHPTQGTYEYTEAVARDLIENGVEDEIKSGWTLVHSFVPIDKPVWLPVNLELFYPSDPDDYV